MRILVVTTWFPSASRPGSAPFNLEHVRAIAERHDVRVIHVSLMGTASASTETYQGVRVRRLSFSPRDPLGMLRTWHEIRRASKQADVLHTMAFSSVLVAAPAHAFTQKPWVHTEHWSGVTDPARTGGLWPRFAWLRYALRRPHKLTGVTSQLADILARFGRRGATSVVPCVVDNTAPLTKATFGDRLQLVAVGGLTAGKRPLLAVQTLASLIASGHQVHLTWVGTGPLADETQELARELGVADSLTLTGGIPPSEVFDRLAAGDLFFLPTAHENFLTSAAEALSSGRAVVVPAVGGYRDYVDEQNGVLVAGSSPSDFADGILRAVERFSRVEPEPLAEPIRQRFSLQAVGDEFDALYRELVAR
jgi:glycosyltransferase involved in cell wall biosynthesis